MEFRRKQGNFQKSVEESILQFQSMSMMEKSIQRLVIPLVSKKPPHINSIKKFKANNINQFKLTT